MHADRTLAQDGSVGDKESVIDEAEALARILALTAPLPSRDTPIGDAMGAFAARDIIARISLPPFDNSAMDGYAVISKESQIGHRLRIIGEQPAGADRHLTVREGTAIRILTGAPMPSGADAVIMQEDVHPDGDEIQLNTESAAGDFVRRRGGDVVTGQKIVTAGERIRPQTLALLAAQGFSSVETGGKVTAAIIATGDELKRPGTELAPGEIYESNTVLVRALLQQLGVEVVSVIHCPDEADQIEGAIRTGVACDVMIISGGVSVGARDFVKPALAAAGAELALWRVAVKPGKPFLFGSTGRCAIFGLPGNPVSAFVTFLLFVRPAILKLMGAGADALSLPSIPVRLGAHVRNESERPHYLRGRIERGVFTPAGVQESHALFGLSGSNALLRLKPGEALTEGAEHAVFTWE